MNLITLTAPLLTFALTPSEVMTMSEQAAEKLTLRNAAIVVTLNAADGTLTVLDQRAKRAWAQRAMAQDVTLKSARQEENRIVMSLLPTQSQLRVEGVLQLDGDKPEFTLTLNANGKLSAPLRFPHPFVTEVGTYLVVPMNEGISYPVEDESIAPMRLIAYGGHGICMAFYGVTDGEQGQMTILETSDDASIRIARVDGKLCIAPEWDAQKGQFGYARRLRCVFFERGGHVAMCKRYRAYAKQTGLLKTLEQKRRECYSAEHPVTRGESRHYKMELLRLVCEEMKLVTGSETGHDAAVPYVHYFEGMLSLGPYRVPDAGRNMQQIWEEVPERVAKLQVGHQYRLPLWELVYHDCVVAQWYWGDDNNKLPAIWDKRDLFNVLYGTPPMFMFNRDLWQKNRERFAQSYKNTCPVVRAVGYAEMTDHRFLTKDRNVQQTVFANGVTITVNFGNAPYRLADGAEVKAMGFDVKGMK